MLGDRFGSCAAFGENDVELFAKHALGKLADALLRHGILPWFQAPRTGLHSGEHDEVTGGDQASSCSAIAAACNRCACRILRHTCSAVSGISKSVTPNGASASSAAPTTAAGAPMAPASPQPLAPRGLWVQGWLSSHSVTKHGRSSA